MPGSSLWKSLSPSGGDLLITGRGRDYPLRIYDASRSLVNYDQLQAKALQRQTLNQQG